jgi:hypothetical protein
MHHCSGLPWSSAWRAQEAIRNAGLGGVIAFNFDNIRYITGTHIGEWARDKLMRYALCPAQGPPFLWDVARCTASAKPPATSCLGAYWTPATSSRGRSRDPGVR